MYVNRRKKGTQEGTACTDWRGWMVTNLYKGAMKGRSCSSGSLLGKSSRGDTTRARCRSIRRQQPREWMHRHHQSGQESEAGIRQSVRTAHWTCGRLGGSAPCPEPEREEKEGEAEPDSVGEERACAEDWAMQPPSLRAEEQSQHSQSRKHLCQNRLPIKTDAPFADCVEQRQDFGSGPVYTSCE